MDIVLGARGERCIKLQLCPQGASSLLKDKKNKKAIITELIRVINNRRNNRILRAQMSIPSLRLTGP